MRRFITVAVAVATCLALPGPASSRLRDAPGPSAGGGQYAEANWLDMRGRGGRWYTLQVRHDVDAAPQARLVALIGVGRCRTVPGKRSRIIICTASLREHALAPGAFRMDPLLEQATVRFDAGGRRHEVVWDGRRSAPSPGLTIGAPSEAAARGQLIRWARADGRVAGQATASMRDVLSWMQEGASFVAPPPAGASRVERRFRLG